MNTAPRAAHARSTTTASTPFESTRRHGPRQRRRIGPARTRHVRPPPADRRRHGARSIPFVDEAITRHGFNMHASLTITADDDLGRERLCRYGLRPPFSLSRFGLLRDGRISYRVKKSSRRVCGGRVEVRAVVTDHDIARKILDAIPTAARAPPAADPIVAPTEHRRREVELVVMHPRVNWSDSRPAGAGRSGSTASRSASFAGTRRGRSSGRSRALQAVGSRKCIRACCRRTSSPSRRSSW